ncbi:hypothetical protein [Halolamina sp.]|jgi:hypothetical protein|uniref:hypothetical protein n=1 Tax=Halolamina sp. TaxID=1940283 RepID=UPI000223B4B0|nr:hypothetical protein Halar_1603 [halophilic archaeon DL31]
MTVCITGDVHHMSMETRDQAYLDGTEVEAAIEYAEIAADHNVPVTLFCTGKCVAEEPDRMARLAAMDNVELGGHNYWAFTTPVHRAWRALEKATGGRIGSWNGPRPFQSWEIRRTIDAFADLGVDVTAWRDHAYRHDSHTAAFLAEYGITHFSDVVGPDEPVRRESGLTVVPVNTPPDHEHVYHAFRTPEFVAESDFEGPFGAASVEPDEWREWVIDAATERTPEDHPATVLAHPACMYLADGFNAFESFCEQVTRDDAAIAMSEIGV